MTHTTERNTLGPPAPRSPAARRPPPAAVARRVSAARLGPPIPSPCRLLAHSISKPRIPGNGFVLPAAHTESSNKNVALSGRSLHLNGLVPVTAQFEAANTHQTTKSPHKPNPPHTHPNPNTTPPRTLKTTHHKSQTTNQKNNPQQTNTH
jgi:hypothetical protein